MIIIQIFLIACFLLLAVFVLFANPRNLKIQAGKKILGIIFLIVAILFVLFPETSNDIARSFGVGRGADLLLYILTLGFIFVTLNFYLRIKEEQNRVVKLARRLAIIEANNEKEKSNT